MNSIYYRLLYLLSISCILMLPVGAFGQGTLPFQDEIVIKDTEFTYQIKGYNPQKSQWKQIEGHARFLEEENVGSLKVSFFGPFYGGYHIIALDRQDYGYSMVAGPSRSYLWILSRNTTLDEAVFADLVSKAGEWGFDTAKLIRVEHNRPDD